MRIVAFDLSLTRTGFATPEGGGVLSPPKNLEKWDRLEWISEQLWLTAVNWNEGLANDTRNFRVPALYVLEGYSFGSKGRAVLDIGELGGIVRFRLIKHEHATVLDVAPATLKKYATGSGRAGKEEVLAAAIRRLHYAGHDNNEADALWLRTMALDFYGCIESPVPKAQRVAMDAAKWPKIERLRDPGVPI